MLNKLRVSIALVVFSAVTAGCEDTVKPSSTVKSVTPVYQGRHCGRSDPAARVTWIQSEAELQDVHRKMHRDSLQAPPLPGVDFETDGLVLIELGRRPTAGYQMHLASQHMVLDKGDGVITFSVDKPAGPAAQVITSPCLLVAVPRGGYRGVRALSTDTTISVQTDLP
ncbi:MAG: hypothetical protein OET44_19755 [Gammaproteobacteria bacterium]|nr:hypothetical protein [Gammaproteobacteria bacterium]